MKQAAVSPGASARLELVGAGGGQERGDRGEELLGALDVRLREVGARLHRVLALAADLGHAHRRAACTIGTVIIFWIGATLSRSLMLSKNDTCLTMGTLFIASPAFLARMLTAMESRLVVGIVPSVENLRGAANRRCLPSAVIIRIAISSGLVPNSPLACLTTRWAMSRNRSRGLSTPLFRPSLEVDRAGRSSARGL